MTGRHDCLQIQYVSLKGSSERKAHIKINGCGLISLLSFMETRIKEPDDEALAGNYRYLFLKELYENLVNAETDGTYEKEFGAPLVCCHTCEDVYCWSVYAVVKRDEDSVVWTLRHNHRNWDYGLKFRFDRKAYDYEMYGLKCYIKRIEEADGNKFR